MMIKKIWRPPGHHQELGRVFLWGEKEGKYRGLSLSSEISGKKGC